MTTFVPPVAPSWSSDVGDTYRTLRADFGDGYSQIVGDGVNATKQTWDLQWNNLLQSEADTIMAFFRQMAGITPFYWKTPEGQTLAFICTSPKKTYVDFNAYNITATFEQVFNGAV